jgi:hypothetical protein
MLLGSHGCNDDPPPSGSTPTTTTAPAATTVIRAAQLTEEARIVDVAVNGQVVVRGLHYASVSPYVELAPGDYRVQFLPEGGSSPALAETTLSLRAGSASTVAIVGLDQTRVVAFPDERPASSDRTGVRLFNAVPDYPSSFDLAVVNGEVLHRGVGYLSITPAAVVLPGFYDFELRRSPYTEVVATTLGKGLDRGANFTVFAVGTLRREDVLLFLARDAG